MRELPQNGAQEEGLGNAIDELKALIEEANGYSGFHSY
jgi:hypothetical protein